MNKLILIFFIFIFNLNCFASWIPKEFIGQEQMGNFKISHSRKQCKIDNPSKTTNCIYINGKYNYRFFRDYDEKKNDYENPNFELKSKVSPCEDEEDCKAKEKELKCLESDTKFPYKVIRSLDNSEIYCTKIVSFPKINTGRKIIKVDEDLKKSYELKRDNDKLEKDALYSQLKNMDFGKKIYAMVQIRNKKKGLTKKQRRGLRVALKSIKEDLLDGNICEAREDISKLTSDGALILPSDISDIIMRIDRYKKCI